MTDLKSEIKLLIAQKLDLGEEFLTDSMTMEELGFDSLTAAEVLVTVEKTLDRRIDMSTVAEKLTRDTTVTQLIEFILEEVREP